MTTDVAKRDLITGAPVVDGASHLSRRGLFGLSAAAAAVAAVPKVAFAAFETPVVRYMQEGQIVTAHLALWPGIREWYGRNYPDGLGGQSRYGEDDGPA